LLLNPDDDPLRVVRREHPAIVVLGCHASKPLAAARACRAIKTEHDPPWVGLLNGPGMKLDPTEMMGQFLADGYLEGPVQPADVAQWVARIAAGERPVVLNPRRMPLWRRWLP
jgi:hypothetical protein